MIPERAPRPREGEGVRLFRCATGEHFRLARAEDAQSLGYARMRLDTLPSMEPARRLYRWLDFVEVPAYYENPIDGAIFMEIALR